MKIVVDKQMGCKLMLYPDNQPHVLLEGDYDRQEVDVEIRLRSALDIFNLLSLSNALEHAWAIKRKLTILYLLGARSDRKTKPNESVELEIVAKLINDCQFNKVEILDVHSPKALQLIKNSVNINNRFLVEAYKKPDAVLICPDKGARTKCSSYREWNSNIKEIVYCEKERNPQTGKIDLKVLDTPTCQSRNCVIIDDICDGGATFLAIAKQIMPLHLTLIVTHGIFSKGLGLLNEHFQEVITSDSYLTQVNEGTVTTIPYKAS